MEYLVTDIIKINNKKSLVCINYEPGFALYIGEIRRYNIAIDRLIADSVYSELAAVLTKRATIRAMALLKSKDYTEHELTDKLKASYYPDEAIDSAIAYVKSYGYIDDYRYIDNYIQAKSNRYSSKIIRMKLIEKGIDKALVENYFESLSYEDDTSDKELELVRSLISKKLKNIMPSDFTYEDKQKLFNYLYRKGFNFDIINKGLNEFLDNTMN